MLSHIYKFNPTPTPAIPILTQRSLTSINSTQHQHLQYQHSHTTYELGGRIVTNKYEVLLAFFKKKGKTLETLNAQEKAALVAAQGGSQNCQLMTTEEAEARSCAAGLERGGPRQPTHTRSKEKENNQVVSEASSMNKLEKKIQKKIHQIEALERAAANGEILEKTQLDKIARKGELLKELEATILVR